MPGKTVYKQNLRTQLEQWNTRIDILAAKTRRATVSARAGYGRELDELRMMQREAAGKLIELEHASADNWLKVKGTADRLWHDLKIGVAGVTSIFRQ
jgi:hypothetical protein